MTLARALIASMVAVIPGHAAVADGNDATPLWQDRAEFRELVRDYQMFVVPHCRADLVAAYTGANAARDKRFVASLAHTPLKGDYEVAVADTGYRDLHTVYECAQPPAPPGTVIVPASDSEDARLKAIERSRFFTDGDKTFALMSRLRDKLAQVPRR